MNPSELKAIDVHVHIETDAHGNLSLPDDFMDEAAPALAPAPSAEAMPPEACAAAPPHVASAAGSRWGILALGLSWQTWTVLAVTLQL